MVPLEVIFNMSILNGNVPDAMKLVEVVTLHKNKDKMILNNYRPISLLTMISKILEKIIYSRIYKYMGDTNQFYKTQYGFRAKQSCEQGIMYYSVRFYIA